MSPEFAVNLGVPLIWPHSPRGIEARVLPTSVHSSEHQGTDSEKVNSQPLTRPSRLSLRGRQVWTGWVSVIHVLARSKMVLCPTHAAV